MITERAVATASLPARRAGAPVRVWAAVGVAFLALQGWIYGSWLLSGDAVSRGTGPTPVPGWMQAAIRIFEVGSIVGIVAFLWLFLIRPWRRAGHITLDGMFTLAFLTMFWQDPLMNLFNTWFTYNASFVAVGSWAPHIPGYFSPQGNLLPQSVVMFLPAYAYGMFGQVLLVGLLLRRMERHRPGWSRLRLIALVWVVLVAADIVIEIIAIRCGLWAFPGAIRELSLFPGTRHQFPLYEAMTLAAFMTAVAAVRHYRDDQGRTAVERGADGGRVRFLALVGFCNVAYLAYNLTFATFGLYGDAWPKSLQNRSYLNDGFCGVGTTYECPSPDQPLPRRGSGRPERG
jgi:hypothetical protein